MFYGLGFLLSSSFPLAGGPARRHLGRGADPRGQLAAARGGGARGPRGAGPGRLLSRLSGFNFNVVLNYNFVFVLGTKYFL